MRTFSHHSHAGESPKKINIAYYPSIITIYPVRLSVTTTPPKVHIIEIRPLILMAIMSLGGVRFFHSNNFIHSFYACKIFAMHSRCVTAAGKNRACSSVCAVGGGEKIHARRLHCEQRVRFSRNTWRFVVIESSGDERAAVVHTLPPIHVVRCDARHMSECTAAAAASASVCAPDCALCKLLLVNHAPRKGAENYSLEFRVHRCCARSLNLENVLVTFLTRKCAELNVRVVILPVLCCALWILLMPPSA